MRINRFIALATGMSRRRADIVIQEGRVTVNGQLADFSMQVTPADAVKLDNKPLRIPETATTIVLHKPTGYVCSRDGQGSKTIYDLLTHDLHSLKPVGRLDKDSSGLLVMTDDGKLAQELTHPSYDKTKVYEVTLDKPLEPQHRGTIQDHGVVLEDGPSRFVVERQHDGNETDWLVRMSEGRNRQIRRTFGALGYGVVRLHRIRFGDYRLGDIPPGSFVRV